MYAKPNGSIKFCHVVWGKDVETKSSNYRELWNLVKTIEGGITIGDLSGSELLIVTYNSAAEGAF